MKEDADLETDEMSYFLSKLSDMDGTEMGEMWELLDALWGRRDYISEEFSNALEKEIKKTV